MVKEITPRLIDKDVDWAQVRPLAKMISASLVPKVMPAPNGNATLGQINFTLRQVREKGSEFGTIDALPITK
jgi:hypothetical protein